MNDWELLQAWASNRSDAAFAELVRRYLDLVHAAARRQVADPELARDVSQAVFLALSQKAGSLSRRVILGGWLLRTTRFVAARAQRTEQRCRHRETAALMDSLTSDSPATPDHWTEVEPQLDAALAALSTGDRDLVALRFFERKSMAEVGTRLGIGEDTAKKRVSRAVERLRQQLTKRGVVLTLAGLVGLLTQLPSNAAPVGLATAITASMVGGNSAPAVMELTRLALRDGLVARIGTVAPWAIALLVLSLVGLRTALSVGRDSDSPAATWWSRSWSRSAARRWMPRPGNLCLRLSSMPTRDSWRSGWAKDKTAALNGRSTAGSSALSTPISSCKPLPTAISRSSPGLSPRTTPMWSWNFSS